MIAGAAAGPGAFVPLLRKCRTKTAVGDRRYSRMRKIYVALHRHRLIRTDPSKHHNTRYPIKAHRQLSGIPTTSSGNPATPTARHALSCSKHVLADKLH